MENKSESSEWLIVIAIASILGAIFIADSRFLFVDGDEGFYLLASKLVYQGQVLYRDIFFTQMPLVPYVYGAWMHVAGETWTSGRLLSALATDALGCLMYLHVRRVSASRAAGLVAVLLFAANISVLAWFPIVKTYALSALFVFDAGVRGSDYSRKQALFFAGVFLGLACDTRLYLLALVPVYGFSVYRSQAKDERGLVRHVWFALGLALALSPNLYWVFTGPKTYYFDNLGYHMIRSHESQFENLRERFAIITGVLGIRPYKEGNGFPLGLLTILNVLPFFLERKFFGPRTWLATSIAFGIIIVCILPAPTYYQYYSIALPFLIPGAVMFVWDYRTRRNIHLASALLVLYLCPLPYDLYRYTVSGKNVLGATTTREASDWRIDTIRQVSREIERRSIPGEKVLSFWPGYLFETNAAPVGGMENHVALSIADQLTPDQRLAFRIADRDTIQSGLVNHTPCLVVLGNQESMGVDGAPYRRMLEADGYRVVQSLGDTAIYNCR
jgi:hypothetical protein